MIRLGISFGLSASISSKMTKKRRSQKCVVCCSHDLHLKYIVVAKYEKLKKNILEFRCNSFEWHFAGKPLVTQDSLLVVEFYIPVSIWTVVSFLPMYVFTK